ncbi:hypothetical protein [Bernardetia sp.]|uniref:hypothetical protein n=1 Tax=Bernardetia sp. TaxID=1937974 RepID=UPI0025BE22C3|nr:hypothetical protein [Bernardetia sp.]
MLDRLIKLFLSIATILSIRKAILWKREAQRKPKVVYVMMHRKKRGSKFKTCEFCNQAFEVKRSDAKYCSNACRQGAFRFKNSDPNLN